MQLGDILSDIFCLIFFLLRKTARGFVNNLWPSIFSLDIKRDEHASAAKIAENYVSEEFILVHCVKSMTAVDTKCYPV